MSILIDRNTKVIVQGITGSQGRFHAAQMRSYGTQVVGGVTPGKRGSDVDGIPVFDTVREAVEATGATASVIFVPPKFAANAILEAAEGGIRLCVCITEGIPVRQMAEIKAFLQGRELELIGPNCPGLITPGECKIGILPGDICIKGHVGVVSRSGTLTYEAISQLTKLGIGQSTAVGIGGDPIHGLGFVDVLERFERDPETKAIVMIGEIGGDGEEEAAEWIRTHTKKPVAAFIAGATAPKGKRMGHAGAIVSGNGGTAAGKQQALRAAGVLVADTPDQIGRTLEQAVANAGLLEACRNWRI